MNRAARREAFFTDDAVCALFVDVLDEVPVLFGARIHGYALMPNHYHLMIEVPRGNLSEVMRHVGARFTQSYNRHRGIDGPLFRGRFKNRLVTDDAYWMHLLAYLHLNPVRAGLARTAEDTIWSSHRAYLGLEHQPMWLTTADLIQAFGSRERIAQYVDDVRRKRMEAPSTFDEEALWSATETAQLPELPPPPPLREPEEALADVAELTGVPVERLLARENHGRSTRWEGWIVAWYLLLATDMTQADVAARLGVSRTRVSQLRQQAYRAWRDVPEARAAMMSLDERLYFGEQATGTRP